MNRIFTTIIALAILILSNCSLKAQITDLQTLKNLYTTTGVKLPSAILNGVVISDTTGKNVSKGNSIFQCGSSGITLYFGTKNVYTVGDSISIDVTGDSLLLYKGSLEIKRKSGAVNPATLAKGVNVTPIVMTIDQILANYDAVKCTLVKILSGTVAQTGTYSGKKTLKDPTTASNPADTLTLYTGTAATFAASPLPTTPMDWVGYPLTVTVKEFLIRSTSDVTTPLPLSFKAFTASVIGNTVTLKWNTATEINTDKFIIERSFDGVNFKTLSTTIKAKNALSNNYSYVDNVNNSKVVYYRIKSVDKDGKVTYSSINKLNLNVAVMLTAYPNPTSNSIKLSFNSFATSTSAVITDLQGKVVRKVMIPANENIAEINVASLAKGVYHVQIGVDNTVSTQFVKQ